MDIRCSERLQGVLGLARGEAIHLRHKYFSTEHLLLGILCESTGEAWDVLKSYNVTLDRVREEINNMLGAYPGVDSPNPTATDRARRVFAFAAEAAIMHRHSIIEPEHLLFGIVREGKGVAAHALINLGVPLVEIYDHLLRQLRRGGSDS